MKTPNRQPTGNPETGKTDWARGSVSTLLWWVLPIAMAIIVNQLTHGRTLAISAWAVALAWMGTGCMLNARRCHRLHCYLAAPVFWIGAALLGLQAAKVVSFGARGPGATLLITLALVWLTYVPERIWGRYLHLPRGGRRDDS